MSSTHQLSIKDFFVLKGNKQKLIDNQVITLPPRLLKALVNPTAVAEGSLEEEFLKAHDSEELVIPMKVDSL